MEDKKPVSSDKWTEALYETLKLNNAYDKDYDTFYNDFYAPGIKGYTYRKDVYDDMTSHGLDLGATYEDFASKIGLHAIDPQTQQTPMGADSISMDMKPVEVTPTKKPEAKKEEKPEVSAEAVSENQHPTDTLQDFNPNVSRMRNAGTNYFLQAAEEISNNAYSYGYQPKSLEELANQAAKDLKKEAYQRPKEDSYVRLNQTARYIPIRSLPKDADLDSVFAAAANFEHMVCGDTKEYTFAPLGGDIQERYEKWKALNINNPGNRYTQETASMSPDAVYIQAKNLKALGYERPAWISELRWNEALTLKDEDYGRITARLQQEDQPRRLILSNGAYSDSVSLKGMYHENITPTIAEGIYYKGSINTTFVLFQDGRIRPLQAPDPSVLRGGWEAQRELFRRQYEKMTFGEEGKEDYTDPYEKNRVVGNFLQNGEVCHIIYFPYMIEQRRWDDAQELIKIGLGGKFNEEGVLLNPDDRLQIVPVVVKNGESEEDAIAKAKVELDNEISKKLPYKETYLQQQIAQAREALKKEQERLKQFGDHDVVKGSYMPIINPLFLLDRAAASTEEGVKRSDEVALARGNIRKLEESIKKYTQALEALRTGGQEGFWSGFLEGISDLDNWTFGLYNLRENLVAVKAHEGGMGQEAKNRLWLARSLSQESMSAFHRYGEGRFYGVGFGTGYSTPFTLGAIATYGVGNTAARGIIRGGSRMAAKYGTNWFFDTTIRATTRLAAINAAGVIDSSFYTPRIISDAAIEKMGLMNYTFDENQRIVVTGTQQEKSWGHSLLHAGLNTLKENVSERVGTYVLTPVAKAFGIGKISLRSFGEALPYGKTIHMIQNGAFAKAMSKVYGTFEKGGYDGFVNEVLEEYIANPMTATFDENYTFADIFNYRQNLDTALSVWASSIGMLGLSSIASSVKYYRTLRSVNNAYDKAEANARRLFGNENWDKIQNTILRLEGEPLVNAIYAGVCQNESLSDEQKKAFLNYVRAQKAQAVFNNAVSEKYSFSLTGEELNEMNAMTVRAYAEGRSMQTPQEYAQAQQAFADTREMAMSALGVTDDIDTYLDTLGETPAEQLKKGVEAAKENGLDEKAANAALSAYLNAREQQKGAMDGITSDESIRRQHADSVIRQITFENEADSEGGSGKVILVNVKGREKPVFLVRGRYENGSITGETVVVSEGNGVIEMIPASEVEGIVEESDAMTERQRQYDKIDAENKEQQRLINLNMDTPLAGQGGILMDEEGHRRQVGIKCVFNDEQGNPASVLVVDQNNNDYLIPIDVFREQRGRGRKFEAIEPYLDETDEEYHAEEGPMNEEYNLANKEQEGVSEEDAQGAAEDVTPQPTTDTTEKPTKPEVKYDYHVKMKDGSGNAVSGRVTNLSADGVEIEFDAPYNGKMVDRIPLADFDNGVSEIADANGNVLWNETEAVGDTEVAPQVDAAPTQVGQNEIDESEKARQARINSSEYKYDKEMRVYGYTGHLYDYRNGVAIYLDEEGNPLIYLAAQNDNTYIGLFRDDSGMWSTKMENASNDKTVFKGLISAVMDMLPEGAKFYEHSNVSVDGLRVFAQQLNHGFKVSDETYECGLNGEDKANALGSKFKGNGKFDSIKHATEADLEHFKGVLKPYMEALGRTTDDIRLGEDGKVLLTLPILIKEGTNAKAGEDVSASDVSNTQKNPTRPIHESASDEVDTKPTGSQDEAHKPTALERIPVNEAGERMFEQADKETALDALDEMTGHNSANTSAIVIAQYKQAQADLEKLKKKAPTRKEPVLRGTPMEMLKAQQEADANYNTAVTQYNAQVAEAEAKLDAWTKIYALMNERERVAREQAEAEQRERDKKLHDEAVAKLEEQKRIAADKAAEQEAVGTHAVNPKIKKKWNDAVKIEGNANAITLADGSTIRGRYVLTESGAATASHDVNNAYEPTEGFPIDENGESVNDRDYKRDKDAQRIVREMADNYDSRALQTPIIVSKDGVVLSGNNRTMSGELAAQQGTDKAYIDYLREFGKMFGFTSEQIEGMKHPRVVFVLDEALPYDAKTFARFNAEQQKRQSKPEHAVKLGKIVPDSVFASITNDISRFDRMSDFYADEKSVDSAISKLLEAGVINEMQLPELRTGNSLSASGKELIENALIGKVFQSSPDAVRQIIGNPTLRQSIIMGLNEIANNRTLAKSGYDLSQELGAAVDLVARAKTLHPDIYKEGVPVSPFGREQGLFDDEYGDSRVTDGIVLLLADLLNSGKPSELRKVLASYNNEAAAFAAGQIDMFSGEVTSKEELLNNVLNHFRNATPKEQQAIVDAAVAERKRRAEASKQVGDTSERSGSDVTNAEVGNSKDAGNGQQDSSKKTNTDKITPIGESDFGFVYDQFKGNAQGAIQQLMKMQDGEALGALHHDEIGDIDLVWGKAGTKKSDGYGLAKLVKFHPEVLDNLQGILDGMHITMRSENRVQLESDEYQAAVRLTWNGKEKLWLLTAFKKKETPEPTNSRTDVDSNLDGKSDDTATRQSSDVSTDKVTESIPSEQADTQENSTQAAVENKGLKPVRFEAGRRLTKEEKKEVLNTLRDAFKENGVPYHIEESDFGKERRVYEPTSEDWVKSDITGRPLRYYITLPDGRVAHPTELFPNISAREVTGHVNRMALLEKEASELISKQLNGFPSEYIPTAISILEKMQSLPHDVRDMGYGPYFLVSYDYIFNGKHYGNSPLFVSLFAHSVVKESSDAIEATVKVVNNSYYMVDALLSALKKKYNSTQSAVESASAEVETSPSEAQKKAGNYKMGHVKIGAFDVTIENPKGSERSGTDANGKKWSVKMNNTYGYIRGTEGVDGDHIDVFLAEDMDKWDGKYVFVVDQYNPDGTFDEHKVMLGFNSTEEARSAYLSNYEKGWENGRRIVVARIKTDGFQKWVDSSHRKTKPFANYVIAGESDVSDNKKKPSASKKEKPRVSKEDEVKRTVEHFPMETPEEAAAFDKRIPEMEDAELLAYMQEDGKGDANNAYHMNIYDEYDYRHTDEQTEAYNTYIQQLHDSNTTLEQAEEMLGNILGDVERFATDERSQLIGQSDALQDYITELERQKEDERAEAENSAENTDANHVEAADVAENKSAEPVEADKSKQYGEYQEVYDNFVSDVENRGMIPDLRAIKNKIRDTKRRLTVLRNGAATSIQSNEDLKRFETAEKKLTDLLHVYEAMRDYTEARVKKAEAAAQRKPWSEKNAQERMDEASKNPLTEEEIQNAPTDEVNKANALDYLSGNHGLIQSISYLKVYEDVRNPNGSAASDSGTKDKTQLAGRSNSASEGRDTGGKSGGTDGRVDNGGSRENVSEQSYGGKSGERSTRDNAGEGSNTGISTEEQPVGRRDANSGKPRRGGTSGRTRSDGGRSGRGESGNPATENGTRRAASESVKEESADDFLNQALGEFKDVLDDFIKAGRGELSISLVGLNSKQMEMLPRLIQVGAKVGYAYIRKGVHGFTEWAKHVKEAIGKYLRDANLSDDEIDAFIKEMWKSKIPFDGQIHTLEEWASIYSKKELRNKVRTTIEEKREAQRQAESISVKTGDINNIRETLPFLLPQQQEDVLRAETQFFDETHQDREHANGKGYMFTNGTGTGKTYTGLGIVKRFVKQGKKRILILTPSQPKVRDWINDGKNLGLEIKSLDDWAKERGTTATTEAGEDTIITTYANFRQNEELLNGTFDLIVYDESHRLMENKNAANTIGTNQHHMIANRDILQATVRLRKINPIYQKLNKVHEEFMAKRENLVSQGLIPYSFNVDNWNEEDAERFPDLAKLRKRYLELRDVIVKEVDPQIEEQAKKDAAHTKVVFLSATPFNTRENIDYAQGYIFSYPDKEQARGYSIASPMTIFFEEHFGAAYKWRYGRLEHSERNAEAIAQQEREFSDWLQHTLCTMSGRIIDSEYDYSRDFPVVSVEHAEEINNAAEEILRDKYFNMAYHKVFGNYNYAGALFETLKVATLIPRIKQHLEAGRKVVIFHRRVESKTPLIPPFAAMLSACHAIIDEMKMKNKPKEEIDAARHRLEELKEKWRGLLKWESMLDYSMPREQIAKAFGADNVLYFSGQESTKEKNQAVDSFNNDESGKNIIVIQEASGKEGISLHDTTGKHQRVLITLALPQSPITALQIEGRIYRIGNRSNAIFEYPLLGLNSEIILFGQKFNGQIGTTENLALGSQARNLRESFARSVEESGKDVPIEEQGFGGKEADAAERDETSPFDRAVLDYYGNQKLKGKRDSREGVDYYPTPEPLGFKMVEWGNLNDGETALEPSAGHGAIARYVPSANPLTAIEPSQNLFAKLQLKAGGSGRKFVNTIFEGYNVVNKHNVIFMNPPFGTGGRLAVDHVAKAFTHLTEGGRIVAIIPRGSTDKKFDKWIDEQENAVVTGEIMLPDITFQQAGTSVMARVLVIDKVTNQSLRSEAESKYRSIDLSRRQYDKIEDFFEDIRDIQMPSRTIDEKARMLKRAAPALRDIKELKGVVDVQAQEDGIDIRTKGSAMGFYLDLTVSDFSLQQQLRTKYQRYAQEIEWNEHRHNEKAVEIYKAYNDLVCRLLGKTAEEVESDITREKMGLEQPHEEQEAAINVAPQVEESPSSEQNGSTTESSPYHYELKHHTKTGAEMFMAMPNEKSGLSSEEYSSMLAKAKKHGGYWNRFMKGFAFPSEKSAKDFLAETGNTEQKPSIGNLYRQGEELSPNHEIRIVEGDENHGFKNYKEAKSWAKSNIARTYSNEDTGGKGEIRISNAAIDKYLSQSAVDKSDSKDVHLAVLKILPDVIRESVNAEQHADYKKGEDGMRNKKNGINPDVTIHRLYGAVRMNGKLYRVKVTLKENNTSKEPKSPHSYEATKIELLAGTLGNSENSLSPSTNNSITAANLLKGVEKSYDAGRFFENYSEDSSAKTQAAQKATENLNLGGRVVVHESAEGLEGKEATAKGWYDTRTGQIHVVLSNNADAADVTQTILHEAVAHHGLRELFGHNVMDAFLDSVLAAASQEVKDAINELRRGNGWNFRTATEEYLAGLAERTDFERMTAEERGLFATIRRLFNRALEFLGLKNHELSDRELAYILWCSYQNLKAGEKGRYVAEAERIAMRYKLKAGKNAMTDTEKKESAVLLRGKLDNLQEILAKDTYERLVTSGSHLERTAWVDMLSPLQDLQHAIEKNGGFKLEDFENPYNAYVTMSSRNYAQMDIYKRTLYADMIEAIHAFGSETGRSYEEIKTYVMAKHGMERQKYMAGKAAEEAYDRYKSMHPFGQKTLDDFIDEYKEKSFAGLTELFGTQSVSDAMDEAQKYVDEVEAEAGSLADSLWDSIRAATKSSLQRAYEAGLISKETYDHVSSMYQYYIPLRGFDETTSDEVYEYFGDQTINGGTGSFMKKAKGRKSVADDPFAVIGNMAEMAIMQSNRNLMKQQLLNLALNHPSDLISVSDLYVKFDEDYDNGDGTRGAWVPVAVPDTSGMTTEEANQVMLDFQDDMEEKVKAEPDTYALAHQKPHIPYRVLGRNMNEHQVMVKRGGKTYILTINGNPRAAQAINGLLNPDATETPGAIALKAMTNWIARMATARNVEFAISNAMRDLEFSTTLIPKEGTEYYGRYVKNYLTCVKNIGRLVNRLNGNTLDMSNPLEKAFYDFIYNGGETGYTFMKGVERYKGEITKALSELRAKEGKSKTERLGNKIVYGHHYIINDAWNIYMKGAEYLSRCTEDWVRFAVFLTSRQSGRSMEQSIMDAKEVTVNFNRKGAGSKSAGTWDVSNFFSMNNLHFLSAYAASAFKNFYAFSNASIQGLDKNVRLHLNHTAGMLMWDGAAVALGMLSAMCIPLMLSAIGGDPDDYWDMPESMRRMGIMLPLGKDGRFLTLPMSIEHRAAYGIGELLGTVVCGSENLPASEITFQACEQLSQILPLDLTEGNGSMLSLVPTAVRPEVEIAFNKNWLGMPIYKEPFNKNTPAFRNVYQSTNPNYIAMSKWLNEVQGGGDYERAGVQVNPAMVQHLVESYTGGAGKFVSRTSGVIAKIIQGEQIRSNEIPFYRTLVKSVDDRTHNRAARERFQREYDKGQKLIYKIDNYQKESARGNSQYVKELDEFAKSKDFMSYMLWKSYNSVKSQFDNARSYIGDNKDKRAALDHAQMLVQKMMTECARAVENSKTQEEADEKIGRIQSEYTPQIKETLSKVED